jgi:6-pyruvoyltetrahydropterin/6-carboxytetrahydropterin synthase
MMTEVFEIYVQTHFSAAHALDGYPGDCARLHGHNWIIDVFVRCKELNDIGIGLDFREIKERVKGVLKHLDHFNLNELPAFQDVNPTSENIARFLYRELSRQLNTDSIAVSRIKVSETPGAGAYYWEEHP